MSMSAWLSSVCNTLAKKGFNLAGVTAGEPYQEYLTNCQSAIVFANGGTQFWECFVEDIRANPEHFTEHQHPVDDFVLRCIESVDSVPNHTRRWITCSEDSDVFLDFRVLAERVGLGHQSPVGLLIHPEYGLWVSMRMVLLTTEHLSHTVLSTVSPCTGCETKPCINACPAGAVSISGWSVQKCASFHRESTVCEGVCYSRMRCPVGSQYRHSKLQHLYHNSRSLGRQALAQVLRIPDKQIGSDPNWSDWS